MALGKIHGEPITGYEDDGDGKSGAFRCDNCEYYRPEESSCGEKAMMRFSKKPKLPNGRRKVKANGCCEFVDRLE